MNDTRQKKNNQTTISRMERKMVLLLTVKVLGDSDLSMEWERRRDFLLC